LQTFSSDEIVHFRKKGDIILLKRLEIILWSEEAEQDKMTQNILIVLK
jgi:hypothetical protein